MYCKKCGFELQAHNTKCPFCNHPVEIEIVPVVNNKEFKKVEREEILIQEEVNPQVEEKIVEDVKKQEYVHYSKPKMTYLKRNFLGYLNLKTQFWHHALIASIGYIAMYVLIILIGRLMIASYQANGIDFSCIAEGNLEACSPEVAGAYMKVNVVSQVVAELLIVIAVALIFMKYLKPLFSEFKDGKTWKWVGIGFGLMYGLTLIYSIILTALDLTSSSTNQDSVNSIIFDNPLLGFLFVVVAAPLFEEIIFRFGIFRIFTNKSKKLEIAGVVITTLLFAFVHMTATIEAVFADINNPDWELLKSDLLSVPSYLIGAFCLTFAYYKSKNLITPMLMHMAWNFMAFISIIGTAGLAPETGSVISNIFNLITETLTRLF